MKRAATDLALVLFISLFRFSVIEIDKKHRVKSAGYRIRIACIYAQRVSALYGCAKAYFVLVDDLDLEARALCYLEKSITLDLYTAKVKRDVKFVSLTHNRYLYLGTPEYAV